MSPQRGNHLDVGEPVNGTCNKFTVCVTKSFLFFIREAETPTPEGFFYFTYYLFQNKKNCVTKMDLHFILGDYWL